MKVLNAIYLAGLMMFPLAGCAVGPPQSASTRKQCNSGALACDPADYLPAARPETTFGWDGASEVTRTTDWARGRRYWVEAGGRRVLLYLEGGQVASAYMDPPGQPRRNLCCGIEECN